MGFSSTICAGCAGCAPASKEALVLLLRAGAVFGSLGSAVFRGFLVFFSGSGAFGSFGFGFGPGFLRGCPDAVRPRGAGDVAFAGVGVLVFAGPTPTPLETRAVDVGVPSGECGGELKLPGEDASFASMIAETRTVASCASSPNRATGIHRTDTKKNVTRDRYSGCVLGAQVAPAVMWQNAGRAGWRTQHQKTAERVYRKSR